MSLQICPRWWTPQLQPEFTQMLTGFLHFPRASEAPVMSGSWDSTWELEPGRFLASLSFSS